MQNNNPYFALLSTLIQYYKIVCVCVSDFVYIDNVFEALNVDMIIRSGRAYYFGLVF